MKLKKKKFSLFLALILFVSACNVIQPTNLNTRETPTESPWSRDGVVYEKPVWEILRGEGDHRNSIHVEVPVKNNNDKPTDVIFSFELWSSHDNSGNVLATCSPSDDMSSSIGTHYTISSNGTAIIQCTHTIYVPINEADFSLYALRYGVIVEPLDENRPIDVEVLETGFEKTEQYVSSVAYTLYAKLQSKFKHQITTRFYVLDDKGVQFMGCETDSELISGTTALVECEMDYRTNMIKQSPASLIVDVIEWEQ